MMTEIVEFRAIMQHLAGKCTIYFKRHSDDTFRKQTFRKQTFRVLLMSDGIKKNLQMKFH